MSIISLRYVLEYIYVTYKVTIKWKSVEIIPKYSAECTYKVTLHQWQCNVTRYTHFIQRP